MTGSLQNAAELHRRLRGETRVVRSWLGGTALVSGLTALVTVAQMVCLSRIVAGVFLEGQGLTEVGGWLNTLLICILVRALLVWGGEVLAQRTAGRIKAELRIRLFRHLLSLGPAWAGRPASGALVSTAVEGIEKLDDYFGRYLPARMAVGIVPLTLLTAAFLADWPSGLVFLVTGPLIPIFMVLIGSRAEQQTRRRWAALSRLGAHFLDVLQGMRTLKVCGRSRAQGGRIRAVGDQYRQATMAVLKVAFLSGLVLELAASISTAVVAVEVGVRLIQGTLAFQTGLFVLLLAPEFYLPFRNLGARHHAAMEGVAAAEPLYAILDARPPAGSLGRGGRRCPAGAEIRLERLSFRYPDSDRPALEGIDTIIPPGQITALAGANGSGKSTLVQVLLRFLDYGEGEVLFGKVPLREIDRSSLLSRVALVPQNPRLFDATVLENIRFARPGASDESVLEAARRAGAHEFIRRLPDGYDTLLGDNGARLSGGERQRVAIARAFLKDAPWLFLDEPASALDPGSEAHLQRALVELAVERTVLVVAHRHQTLRRADRILFLDGGRLVAAGPYDALSGRSELFADLPREGEPHS